MYQYLHKYLVLNHRLSIPDVGNFVIEPNTAKLDNANGFLFAPAPAIRFKQEQTPPSDKFLFDFISEELGVDQMTAIKQFHDYVYKIKTSLTTPQGAIIPGIGAMRKEENGYILFTPEKNLLDLLPQVKVGETIEFAKKEAVKIPGKLLLLLPCSPSPVVIVLTQKLRHRLGQKVVLHLPLKSQLVILFLQCNNL